MKLCIAIPTLALFLLTCTRRAHAVELNGAGASFPFDVYSAWMPAYKAYRRPFHDVAMKYDSIGSGGGKARIKGETGPAVAYAGSDSLLKKEEYQAHPDLQMLPSIAGAIVMAFNIPGVSKLCLSMAHVVGIYNGSIRFWNDSSLAGLNPDITLPDRHIHVVARRDKSGTTELFTAALSAVDVGWRNWYGSFSRGLRPDDTPYVWDSSVVTLYGQTNRGVSGMVLSTKFSIGYLVLSDAINAKLDYALLLNAAGTLVEATVQTVQSAMDDFADAFSNKMTSSLANPPGVLSYPISGYTYLIIRMTSMADCEQATELVRYIEWFFTDRLARVVCENLYMVPLSPRVYGAVMDKVLERVQCGGNNVYSMVLAQKEREELILQTWRTPVYVSVPIIGLLMIVLVLYLVRDQIRTNRGLLTDEWKIPHQAIVFTDNPEDSFGSRPSVFRSRSKIYPSMSTVDPNMAGMPAVGEGAMVGHYKGRRVLLTALSMLTDSVNLRMKRAILKLRDLETFDHVARFYGLYFDTGSRGYCSVSDFYANGTLQTLLHDTRYHIDSNFKYALCLSVAKGMKYLHSHKLTHASLTSSRIYMDDNWSVRICGWEVHKIVSLQKKSPLCLEMAVSDWARDEFWTAPEVLSQKSLPTLASDVYSFAIVMQEIFTRDTPYSEQSALLSPEETLSKVVCESLRPLFNPDTPLEAREIMQTCWEMDPLARPSMENVVTQIKKACPKIRSVMDSMLDSLMHYVTQQVDTSHLMQGMTGDKNYSEQDSEIVPRQTGHTENKIQPSMILPQDIASVMDSASCTPQLFDSVSVLLVNVTGLDLLIKLSTAQEVIEFMSDVHLSVETLLHSRYQSVLKVYVDSNSYTLAAGLPQRTADHLKVLASLALDMLTMASTFTIRHRREDTLSLRMGLGTGSVVTGLVGCKWPLFTMFGEALWRAQSMMDDGLPRGIQMNDATHTALTTFKHFTCVERKHSKEKHESKWTAARTYWLVGHRDMAETFIPQSG